MSNTDVSSFKRPINEVYPKRNDLDSTTRSTSGAYDQRGGVSSMSSGKDHRFNDSVDNRGGSSSFGRNRVDDRDVRYVGRFLLLFKKKKKLKF